MPQLISNLLAPLGNARAVTNARVLLDDRRAEDLAVRTLERRVAARTRPAPTLVVVPSVATAA